MSCQGVRQRRPRRPETWQIPKGDNGCFSSAPSAKQEGRGPPLAQDQERQRGAGASMPFLSHFPHEDK